MKTLKLKIEITYLLATSLSFVLAAFFLSLEIYKVNLSLIDSLFCFVSVSCFALFPFAELQNAIDKLKETKLHKI